MWMGLLVQPQWAPGWMGLLQQQCPWRARPADPGPSLQPHIRKVHRTRDLEEMKEEEMAENSRLGTKKTSALASLALCFALRQLRRASELHLPWLLPLPTALSGQSRKGRPLAALGSLPVFLGLSGRHQPGPGALWPPETQEASASLLGWIPCWVLAESPSLRSVMSRRRWRRGDPVRSESVGAHV